MLTFVYKFYKREIASYKFYISYTVTGNSGDRFEDLSEGVHSISIQFVPAGLTQALNCLNQNFTISHTSKLHR